MYRDGGGFTAYVIPEWATICHPRMGHNMSSPNGPQYVIPECTYRGSSTTVIPAWA